MAIVSLGSRHGPSEYQLIAQDQTYVQPVIKHSIFHLLLREEDVKALESSPTHVPQPFPAPSPAIRSMATDCTILYVSGVLKTLFNADHVNPKSLADFE